MKSMRILTIALLVAVASATGTGGPHIFETGDGEHDCCSTCSDSQRCIIYPDHCECHDLEPENRGDGPRIIGPGGVINGATKGVPSTMATAHAFDTTGGPVFKGAEDDADDCCDKCAEGEACATTPTGCECWTPGAKATATAALRGSKGEPGAALARGPATMPTADKFEEIKVTFTNKGAEDDHDNCCKKCAADEACSSTPTGCECWKAASLKVPDEDALPASLKGLNKGGLDFGATLGLENAEDDHDDCCKKCSADEACSSTPTGCECWTPSSVQAMSNTGSLGGQEGDPAGVNPWYPGEPNIKASPTQALAGLLDGLEDIDGNGVVASIAERVHKEITHFVEEAGHHIGDADWDGVPETYLKALLDISERVRDGGLTAEQLESVLETFKFMDQEANKEGLYASGRTTGLIPDDEGQTTPFDMTEDLHNNGAFLPWHREFMRLAASVSLEHGPGPHDSVVAADYDGKVKNTLNFVKDDEANHGTLVGNPGDVNNMKDVDVAEESFKAGLFEPYHEVAAGSAKLGAVADLEADAAKFAGKIHPTVEENNVAVLGQANGVSASPEAPDNVAVLGQANGMTNGRPATHGGTGKDLTTAASNANTAVPDVMTNTAEGGLNSFEEVKVTLANDAASDPEIVADNFAVSNEAEGVVQEHPQSSTTSAVLPLAGIGGFALLAGGLAFACRPGARKRRAPATPREEPVPVVNVV